MTKRITKIQHAALILLDAGFDHSEVARIFGMTLDQVQYLRLRDDEDEDRELTAICEERQSEVGIQVDINSL